MYDLCIFLHVYKTSVKIKGKTFKKVFLCSLPPFSHMCEGRESFERNIFPEKYLPENIPAPLGNNERITMSAKICLSKKIVLGLQNLCVDR